MIGLKLSIIVWPTLALLGSEIANGNTIKAMPITRIGHSTLRLIFAPRLSGAGM
jgi:hypothetical protein